VFTTQADSSWRPNQNVCKLYRQLDTRLTLSINPMTVFLKAVAIASGIVGMLALWARLPLRAALLFMIAAVVWSAQKRTLLRPSVMVAAAIAVVAVLIANFIGPYSLALFDAPDARP
jgi:hypothetical protein